MIDMSELIYRFKTLPLMPRILLFSLAGLLILGLLLWSFSDMLFPASPSNQTTAKRQPTANPVSMSVSPLIFGTNLGLLNAQDQVLASSATQSELQLIHTRIIRIPVRLSLPEATEIQAAQTVKNLGLVPLVDLAAGADVATLSFDAHMVRDMNSIFGTATVYYEYGNEEDLLGTSAASYTASWNTVIPQVKQLAPHAQFVGPVTYHYDHTYLSAFLINAQPKPDEISWHEYTCVASDTTDTCLSHIQDWNAHITDARTTSTSIVGKALPIMITEWNYAPDAVSSFTTTDTKSKDSAFLTVWTQKALQTLTSNHVFASMQYYCTSSVPLIASDNTVAPQGLVFQSQYEQLASQFSNSTVALQGTPPATVTDGPTSTPTATATDGSAATPTPTAITGNTSLPPSNGYQPTPTVAALPTATAAAQSSATATATTVVQATATPGATVGTQATATTVVQATATATVVNPQDLYTTVTGTAPAYTTTLASQDGGKWDTGLFNGGGTCSFTGGTYQISVPQKSSAGVCTANGTYISNFAYQVQMTIISGDGGGLVFRDANQQMYRFRVGSDGTYDLVSQSQVLAAGPSAAIKSGPGQINTLMVIAKDAQIYIYVNQQFLTSVTDTASSGGKLGVFAVDFMNATTVAFKNVQVWQL